jgi:ribosomal protein S26
MAKFKEAAKGKKFRCDNCKEVIPGEKLKLRAVSGDVRMTVFTASFRFVDRNGIIKGGSEAPKKGDKLIFCPKCDHAHLFGMDMVA